MARVGEQPIQLTDKVKVSYADKAVTVSGDKGTLSRQIHEEIDLDITDNVIRVTAEKSDRRTQALKGLVRSLVNNMVAGVEKGFERGLEINGIGYRAEVSGNAVILNIGFSHPVNFELPEGISARVEKNVLTLSGIDKELVGNTAAAIRRLRPPEPYKGRGIKYVEEYIQRKAGKTA